MIVNEGNDLLYRYPWLAIGACVAAYLAARVAWLRVNCLASRLAAKDENPAPELVGPSSNYDRATVTKSLVGTSIRALVIGAILHCLSDMGEYDVTLVNARVTPHTAFALLVGVFLLPSLFGLSDAYWLHTQLHNQGVGTIAKSQPDARLGLTAFLHVWWIRSGIFATCGVVSANALFWGASIGCMAGTLPFYRGLGTLRTPSFKTSHSAEYVQCDQQEERNA